MTLSESTDKSYGEQMDYFIGVAKEYEWDFIMDPDGTIDMTIPIVGCTVSMCIRSFEEPPTVQFICILEVIADENTQQEMCNACNELNGQVSLCSLIYSKAFNVVCFKYVLVEVQKSATTEELLEKILSSILQTVTSVFPVFADIAYGKKPFPKAYEDNYGKSFGRA